MKTSLVAIVLGSSLCISSVVLGCPEGKKSSHNPPGFNTPPGNSSVKDDSAARCLTPMSARRGTHLSNRPSYKEFVEKHPRLAERLKEKRHFRRDRHPADRWEDIRDRKEDFCDKREDIRDRLEDVRDRREDIRDRRHRGGRLDRLEDIRDRREDVRDHLEDLGDRKEDVFDNLEDKKDRQK